MGLEGLGEELAVDAVLVSSTSIIVHTDDGHHHQHQHHHRYAIHGIPQRGRAGGGWEEEAGWLDNGMRRVRQRDESRRWRRAARKSADDDYERGLGGVSYPRIGSRAGEEVEGTGQKPQNRGSSSRTTGDVRGLVSRPSASAGLRVTTGERRRHPYRPLATRPRGAAMPGEPAPPSTCRCRAGVATLEVGPRNEEPLENGTYPNFPNFLFPALKFSFQHLT